MMKLYVGNLSFKTTEDQLRQAFEAHGQVSSATVVMDRDTGRPRGFGFVEMPNDDEARAAVEALNGKPLESDRKPDRGSVMASPPDPGNWEPTSRDQ